MIFRLHATFSGSHGRSIVVAALVLNGCVFVPKTVDLYDSRCQTAWKQMELEPVQLAVIGPCSNGNCAAELAVVGAVAAASAVVSGSIVVVGNVVYWMEKQGRCLRKARAPATPVDPALAGNAPPDEAGSASTR